MPIQNTKLVMSNAPPTVRLSPHTPMPVAISYATIATPMASAIVDTAKQAHHPAPGRVTSGRITSSVISRSGDAEAIDGGTIAGNAAEPRGEGAAFELMPTPSDAAR